MNGNEKLLKIALDELHKQFGSAAAVTGAVATLMCCVSLWFVLGVIARRSRGD